MSTSSFFSGRGSHGAYLNILRKYKLNLHFFKLSPSVVSSSNRISNFEIKIISKLTQDLHHLVNIHIIFTRSCWIDFTDSCLLFCSGCVGVYQYLIRSSREEVVDRFTVTVVSLQSRFENQIRKDWNFYFSFQQDCKLLIMFYFCVHYSFSSLKLFSRLK